MKIWGLWEILTHTHGDDGPKMFQLEKHPIDGMYVSKSLMGSRCGYLDYVFDHWCLWIDNPYSVAFGYTANAVVQAKACRLELEDPRIVLEYQTNLVSFCKVNNLTSQFDRLYEQDTSGQANHKLQTEWKAIYAICCQGITWAERHCRKIQADAIEWVWQYSLLIMNCPLVAQILAGTYTLPPSINPYAAQLIPHLSLAPGASIPTKAESNSFEQYCQEWRKAKERTSSGRAFTKGISRQQPSTVSWQTLIIG
jgi:hypothetical protein